MKNDKKTDTNSYDGSLTPEEEHRIEVKIDKMLDPRAPDSKSAATEKDDSETDALPPIDIFSDPKTAPEVPEEVVKKMTLTDEPEAAEESELPEETAKPKKAKPPKGVVIIDDSDTEAAVDDITSHESDEVLAAEDAKNAEPVSTEKRSFGQKIKHGLHVWWHNKKARYGTFAGIVVLLVVLAGVPMTRAFALNLAGVRGTVTLTVLDNTTQLPLKGVDVTIGGGSASSDANGHVTVSNVKLGSQDLDIQKTAFAVSDKKVNITWGANDFGNVALTAIGTQYKFSVTDYVSGKPVTSATASSGESSAKADSKGLIVLTVTNSNAATLTVNVGGDGYQTSKVSVPLGTKTVSNVALVSSRQEVYVSKQSGKYDVYKSGIDGQNKKLLLAGTGTENSQLTLVANQDGSEAALVSTRDNIHDSGGYLEQALTLINVSNGTALTIDHSDRVQIIDWSGDRIVYVVVKPGVSAGNPSRYLLMSYDFKTSQRLQLDHANYFNDVVSADGSIYYATSNEYSGGVSQFMKIDPDGSDKTVLLVTEVWNIYRTDYNDFSLATATNWYTYALGDAKPVQAASSYNYTGSSRQYVTSPDGKHSLWVDSRDGKGTLISYDTTAKKETILAEANGITYPVRWLDNQTVIYRVSTSTETADYVVSLNGGTPKKITDLTDVAGLTLWYYY